MLRHPVSPKGVLLIVLVDKITNFSYDVFKVIKITYFNYDLFKANKMTNFK